MPRLHTENAFPDYPDSFGTTAPNRCPESDVFPVSQGAMRYRRMMASGWPLLRNAEPVCRGGDTGEACLPDLSLRFLDWVHPLHREIFQARSIAAAREGGEFRMAYFLCLPGESGGWVGDFGTFREGVGGMPGFFEGVVIRREILRKVVGGMPGDSAGREGLSGLSVFPAHTSIDEGGMGGRFGGTGTLRERLDLAEKAILREELARCRWNRSAAAKVLGVDRRTLYTKIRRHGLAPEDCGTEQG